MRAFSHASASVGEPTPWCSAPSSSSRSSRRLRWCSWCPGPSTRPAATRASLRSSCARLAKAEREDFLRVGQVELGAFTDELHEKALALGRRDWELEARGEARLVGDRQRLTQAMMGLAQNAVQHTKEGDRIWIGSAVDDSEASLWVRDTGPGIPNRDQERIFERSRGPARAGGARRAPGSASRSCARSPSPTTGASSWSADRAPVPRLRSWSPCEARRWPHRDEPHPDRRGRAATVVVPGEGPPRRRARHDRLRRRRQVRGDGARRGVRPDDPRHRHAGPGRLRGAARHARPRRADARAGPHRPRRDRRHRDRPGHRRRRLRDQAVHLRGAAGACARACAAARRPAAATTRSS